MSHTDPPTSPLRIMKLLGFEPDPWQQEVLETTHKRILLNCARHTKQTQYL